MQRQFRGQGRKGAAAACRNPLKDKHACILLAILGDYALGLRPQPNTPDTHQVWKTCAPLHLVETHNSRSLQLGLQRAGGCPGVHQTDLIQLLLHRHTHYSNIHTYLIWLHQPMLMCLLGHIGNHSAKGKEKLK